MPTVIIGAALVGIVTRDIVLEQGYNSVDMDKISVEVRSSNMAKIKGRDAKPEIHLRKSLFALGYRYRINCKIDKFT